MANDLIKVFSILGRKILRRFCEVFALNTKAKDKEINRKTV